MIAMTTFSNFNDLRQTVGAPFFSKSFNIPRASQKTPAFMLSILWRQIDRRENVVEHRSAQVPMLSISFDARPTVAALCCRLPRTENFPLT
jgi:hypothetical protein